METFFYKRFKKYLANENRRKASGIIVDSGALLRLSIPFFVLLISNVIVIIVASMQISTVIEEVGVLDLAAAIILFRLSTTILNTMNWGMFVLGTLSAILWVIFSHRIFGPVVPIRRQLEKLARGDYNETVHLRKHDEFKEIASDLNRLTDILKNSRP